MIKIFEGFAGYGTSTFALKRLNLDYRLVGFSEINKYAIQCFKQNHNGKNYGDITKINWKDVPDFDLLTSGFPCQDVSFAGKRDLNNGRTILGFELIKILKVKQPKYFLFENVKGILSKKFKSFLNSLLEQWKEDYDVYYKTLNTKDYNIPQNRERVFFVGIRKDLKQNFKFPKEEKLTIKLKDILEKEIDEKYYLTNEQINKLRIRNEKFNMKGNRFINEDKDYFSSLVCNSNKNDSLIECRKIQTSRYGDHLYNGIPKISPTLCAIGECDVSRITIKDKKDNNRVRKLTPKECFRLQGFLDDEINLKDLSNNQLYKLAGNGQSVNVVERIFREMFK